MDKPNIELLKRLRTRFLRMRHKRHFNMKILAAKTDCGSAMCIAGHALDLQGYAMRLKPEDERLHYAGRVDYDFISPHTQEPVEDALESAASEMGLAYKTAHELFHDFSIKTPKQAARRIERLIAVEGLVTVED